jgi:hypothetical protein
MDTEGSRIKLKFPLWQYLVQPLFSPDFKSLNPFRFWRLYTLEQLENVWIQSGTLEESEEEDRSVPFLEDCWLQAYLQGTSHRDSNLIQFLEQCWTGELCEPDKSLDRSEEYSDESEEFHS